jgi:YegS/Rv2252/BmrU family lipid kinase
VKCLLLLNPGSRDGGIAHADLQRLFEAHGAELVGGVHEPQALPDLLAGPEREAIERIVVGGGDGTLNKSLADLIEAQIPVGLLPLGTANDLAHNLGIPEDVEAAVQIALRGREWRIDVGRVDGAPFLNVATVGLGPAVTKHLTSELKARLGFLSYPRALITAYRESKPFRVDVQADGGQEMRLRCIHLAVGNGRYYGGGAIVNHPARLDDGLLHLSALRPTPLWRLLLQAPLVSLGWHRPAPDAVAIAASAIRIETHHEKPISADGEIVATTPASFQVEPRALTVLVSQIHSGSGIRSA